MLETIATQADQLDVSLPVLGARGADSMRQWLLGATAERLLRKVRRPILVVKQTRMIDTARFWSRSTSLPGDSERYASSAPNAELTLMHAFGLPDEGKLRLALVDPWPPHQGTERRRRPTEPVRGRRRTL